MFRAPAWNALFFASAVTVSTVAACGGDEPAGPGADGGASTSSSGASGTSPAADAALAPLPREQFADAVYDALCSGLEACCRNAGYDYVEGACDAAVRGDAGAAFGSFVDQLNDPTTIYDPRAAAACVQTLKANNRLCTLPSIADPVESGLALLSVLGDSSTGCMKAVTGPKQPGEPCEPGQCAVPADAYLVVCGPLAPKGPAVCRVSRLAGEGAACDDPEQHGAELRQCGDTSAVVPRTAAELRALIENGLSCDQGTCKRTSSLLAKENEPCGDGRDCGFQLTCHQTSKICVPEAQLDQPCEAVLCTDGTTCDSTRKTCKAQAADGTSCAEVGVECVGDCNAKKICAPKYSGIANAQTCHGASR